MYIPKHFSIHELVWKEIYEEFKHKTWILWRRFDDRFLKTIDTIRDKWGACYYNDYNINSVSLNRQYAGARPHVRPANQNWSLNTTHKDWNSGDVVFGDLLDKPYAYRIEKYRERYQYILDNPEEFQHITVLEDISVTKTYIHFSTGNFNHSDGKVRIVKP